MHFKKHPKLTFLRSFSDSSLPKRSSVTLGTLLTCSLIYSSTALAADKLAFDIGTFADTPQAILTNPAVLHHCEPQIHSAAEFRSSDFELTNNTTGMTTEPQQLDDTVLAGSFGGCAKPFEWLTVAGYLNYTSITFHFESERIEKPMLIPYAGVTAPVFAGGGAVHFTENLNFGWALRGTEQLNLDYQIDIGNNDSIVTELDITLRIDFSWIAGLSYELGDHTFHASYSPTQQTDFILDVDTAGFEDLPTFSIFQFFDTDLVVVRSLIAHSPARTRAGVLSNFDRFSLDLGIVEEKWTEYEYPFLVLEAPLLLSLPSTVVTNITPFELQDTINPYAVAKYRWSDQISLIGGYAFKENPVASSSTATPVVGGDTHVFKMGSEYRTVLFDKYKIRIGGSLVVGFIDEEIEGRNENLDGHFIGVSTFANLFL